MQNSKQQDNKIKNLFGSFPGANGAGQNTPTQKQIREKYNAFKILGKSLNNCAYRFHQIGSSYLDIKNHLKIVTNEIKCIQGTLANLSAINMKKLKCLNTENNGILLEIIEESYEKIAHIYAGYSTSINNFMELYAATIKKKYARFQEEAQSLGHYKQKVNGLSGCAEYNKIQRNRNKLSSAQRDYDQVSIGLNANLKKILVEGWNMIIEDYSQSLVTFLKEIQQIQSNISNSLIRQKHKNQNMNFLDIVGSQKDSQMASYQNIQSLLLNNSYKMKLRPQNISLYFKAISFNSVNNQNLFDSIQSGQQKQEENHHKHFKAFKNIFGHRHNHKKHDELHQIKDQQCHSANHKIRVKEVRKLEQNKGYDAIEYKSCMSAQMKKKSTNTKQEKSSEKSNKKKIERELPKPRRKQSIDLLDLDI